MVLETNMPQHLKVMGSDEGWVSSPVRVRKLKVITLKVVYTFDNFQLYFRNRKVPDVAGRHAVMFVYRDKDDVISDLVSNLNCRFLYTWENSLLFLTNSLLIWYKPKVFRHTPVSYANMIFCCRFMWT